MLQLKALKLNHHLRSCQLSLGKTAEFPCMEEPPQKKISGSQLKGISHPPCLQAWHRQDRGTRESELQHFS